MMAEAKFFVGNYEFQFDDSDVVNPRDYSETGQYNWKPYLLHDSGFTLAVVFAQNLEDALDEAVDADKLDRFLLTPEELAEYEKDGNEEGISFLGNAGEPFDIESLGIVELPNVPFSFAALFAAANPTVSSRSIKC